MNKIMQTGIDLEKDDVSGTLMVENEELKCGFSKQEGVTVANISRAIEDGLAKDYWWQLIDPQKDEYTRDVFGDLHNGYFIKTKKGVKSKLPVQTCLYVSRSKFVQKIHNIIVAEDNSELRVVTGCLTGEKVEGAKHLGITEIYVGKNAKVVFTMIHNWDKTAVVRPRTVIKVAQGGSFVSNYVCLNPVSDIQMYPKCILEGKDSRAVFNSVIFGHPGSVIDTGARIELNGENSSGEIVSKIVCDNASIYNRGKLVGNASGIRAHLECNGLMTSEKGLIVAIPEIEARLADLEMTHEASIGRISRDQIEYLQTRGLSEKEASGMIVRGFLDVSSFELPKVVAEEVAKIG
ncbi:MAG: SufD family Fe-S cluster assembly protein [Candidatus Shapirobacteria bacterium]|jgi:hypothetical protein